ncbi:hypothetical protein QNE60_004740 [Vibrio harveyi]|nr:hypothetical protein [Vibrio harveyi]
MFVKRYALHSVKRPWVHRINILLVLFVFSLSVYELLANEEFIYLLGIAFTFIATALFAAASSFKKRYLGHES